MIQKKSDYHPMIITTTHKIAGYKIESYLGLVNANQVVGANLIADFMASFSDVFGGSSGAYRERLDVLYKDVKNLLEQKASSIGANAILGVHIDFDEISGKGKSMFMITAYGTAVIATPEVEKLKKTERYEVYQKLYNLAKFKEAGIITDEQYEAEKNNIILSHEASIAKEIEDIKSENEHKEAVKQAQILSQKLAEQRETELQEELQRQAEERRQNMTTKEYEAELRKAKEPEIEEAYKKFLSKVPTTIIKVRNLLSSNVVSPQDALSRLTFNDIMSASYESMEINSSNKAAFNIGLFLKHGQVAEACKYYIDLVGDDDIDEAKSYVYSIYEMMAFKDQKAFERMAKNLIELKCLGKIDEAIIEFSMYAVCDKEIARQVIKLL